jgi:hypothetical protein
MGKWDFKRSLKNPLNYVVRKNYAGDSKNKKNKHFKNKK